MQSLTNLVENVGAVTKSYVPYLSEYTDVEASLFFSLLLLLIAIAILLVVFLNSSVPVDGNRPDFYLIGSGGIYDPNTTYKIEVQPRQELIVVSEKNTGLVLHEYNIRLVSTIGIDPGLGEFKFSYNESGLMEDVLFKGNPAEAIFLYKRVCKAFDYLSGRELSPSQKKNQ
eukprot:TRINITY_DN969_c0_g1_i1.p1 TRINITY_DN969_c0_g1~~TRINITY_DN969_c0_g1_i1.p1  ORF type:complete len:182 (-),score=23.63 TRINITY_DN969_c0_g1_i1:931-1443(-)